MIKLWAKIITDNKIKHDLIYESADNYNREEFFEHISEICYKFNIPTPVIVENHLLNYEEFNMVKFLPRDFVESVDFDKLEIENAKR